MTPPTPILLDTFTDADATALTAHTGDSGNTWSALPINTGTAMSITGNQLTVPSFNGGYLTGPALTDATAMFDNSPQSSPIGTTSLLSAIPALINGAYSGNYYSGAWQLFRDAGSYTSVASATVGVEFPTSNTPADIWTSRLCRRTVGSSALLTLIINGRKVISWTDTAPLAGQPGIFSNNSGTGAIDNFRVFHATDEVGIALIGDSVTYGATITTPPDIYYGSAITRGKTGLPAIVYNHGVSSTTTADWVNSTNSASLASVISYLQSQRVRIASILLGSNDAKTAGRISIANHKSNIATICSALNAAGVTVILNRPPYLVPGSFGAWDQAAVTTYLPGYWEAQLSLINGQTILLGDTQGYDLIASDPTNRTTDGAHPTQAFSKILFQMHANALLSQFAAGSSGNRYINQNVDGRLL
jgi:lysophospholipase L1-like esterase